MTIKSYAKVNIFLKITALRGSYHEINSRFMLVKNLFDTISFEPKQKSDEFILEGDFGCQTKDNTIYKVYQKLKTIPKVEDFFKNYKVVVDKNIPEFAGLGGGSSNCAAFLNLTDKVLNLNLSLSQKLQITTPIGSDIAFFVYEVNSANVSGVGEVVEKFDEDLLDLKTFTPPIKCSTKEVYQTFRKKFLRFDKPLADKLSSLKSDEILKEYNAKELNDLLSPALFLYPNLKDYLNKRFFSGSGSSLFWRS